MGRDEVGVVGAGLSGLIAATELAAEAVDVVVIERLPHPGGQEPEPPITERLGAEARSAGVKLLLGTLAVSWDSGRLETLGVEGARALSLDALVIATGTRPRTRAELGIAGDRCAGVVAGSAAVHLTECGVLLGHDPVIVGSGQHAARIAELILDAGARSVTVAAPGLRLAKMPTRAEVLTECRVISAHGQARVVSLLIEKAGEVRSLRSDALILAEGRVPMRNVEGAITVADRVFSCHSSADPKSESDARDTARACVAATVEFLGDLAGPKMSEQEVLG